MKRQVGKTGGNAPTRTGRVNTAKGRTPGAPSGKRSRPGREDSRDAGSGTSRCRGTRRCMTRPGRRDDPPPAGVHPDPERNRARRETARAHDAPASGDSQSPPDRLAQRRSGRSPEAGRPGTTPRDRRALKGPKPYERRSFPRRFIVPKHQERRKRNGPAMRADGHGDYYVMRDPRRGSATPIELEDVASDRPTNRDRRNGPSDSPTPHACLSQQGPRGRR